MYYNPIPLLEATADLRNLLKARALLIESGLLTENIQAMAGLDKSLDHLDKEVDKAILSAEKIADVYTAISNKSEAGLSSSVSKMFGASKSGDIAGIVATRMNKMIPALKGIAKMDFSDEITGKSWKIGDLKRGIGDFLGRDSSEAKALSKLEAIAVEMGEFSNLMVGAIASIARGFKYAKDPSKFESDKPLSAIFSKKELKALQKEIKRRTKTGLKSKMMGWLQNINPRAEVSNLFGVSSGDIVAAWFQCTPQLFTQVGPEMLKPLQTGSSNLTKALAQTTKDFSSFGNYAEKENIEVFKPSMMGSADSTTSATPTKVAELVHDEMLETEPNTEKIEKALDTMDTENERQELLKKQAEIRAEMDASETEKYTKNRDMVADRFSNKENSELIDDVPTNTKQKKKITKKIRKQYAKNVDKALLKIESVEDAVDEALDLLEEFRILDERRRRRRSKKKRSARRTKRKKNVRKKPTTKKKPVTAKKPIAKKEPIKKKPTGAIDPKKSIKSKEDKSKEDKSKEDKKDKSKQSNLDRKKIKDIRNAIKGQIMQSIDKAIADPKKYASEKNPKLIKKATFSKKKFKYIDKKGKQRKVSSRDIARKAKISEIIQRFDTQTKDNVVTENIHLNGQNIESFERWLKIAGIDKK